MQYTPLTWTDLSIENIFDANFSVGVWSEAWKIGEHWETCYAKFIHSSISRTNPRLEFNKLAAIWRYNSKFMSSSEQMAMLPEYQKIIGMWPDAIPYLLEELRDRPGNWFWALRSISRRNPVSYEDKWNMKKMIESWLQWGRRNKYIV